MYVYMGVQRTSHADKEQTSFVRVVRFSCLTTETLLEINRYTEEQGSMLTDSSYFPLQSARCVTPCFFYNILYEA